MRCPLEGPCLALQIGIGHGMTELKDLTAAYSKLAEAYVLVKFRAVPAIHRLSRSACHVMNSQWLGSWHFEVDTCAW